MTEHLAALVEAMKENNEHLKAVKLKLDEIQKNTAAKV